MAPSITPHEFIAKWSGDTRKERSVSQEHFIDLCRLVGHETPGENRDGTLVFEAGAAKSAGGQGWADVWKKGHFGWEYKGPRADLGKAFQQLQQYRFPGRLAKSRSMIPASPRSATLRSDSSRSAMPG